MTTPRYQELSSAKLPKAETKDGLAKVTVVAGEALGTKAAINTLTPIVYQDWSLRPGADVTLPIDETQRVLVYVFDGEAKVGGRLIKEGQLAQLGNGDAIRLQGADTAGRMLVLAGVPLNEPIARYGPFVMNTRSELIRAFEDFESGRMGEITRTAIVG
ncbi:MAG: pirin-like C-terminal cupin domain-containing protein [Myxococcaceae bacterium]